MRDDIGRQLAETRPPESATAAGKTWLRGWDDWKKPPPAGTTDLPAGTNDLPPGDSRSKAGQQRRSSSVETGDQSIVKGAKQSAAKVGRVLASTAAAVGGEPP